MLEATWPEGSEDIQAVRIAMNQLVFGVADLQSLILDAEGSTAHSGAYEGSSNEQRDEPNHCDVRVRCDPDASVQTIRRGVVFIAYSRDIFKGGSGSFVNNTKNDCKRYVLTAEHVIPGYTTAASATFYYNHELECNGSPVPLLAGSTGSVLRASWPSPDICISTAVGTDFALVELNGIPASWSNVRMNGWDASLGGASSAVIGPVGVIHHPNNQPKEIAVDDDGVQACSYGYKVVNYEAGGTRRGSSGAPLFSDQGRIVGQLHGGGHCWCDGRDCGDTYGGIVYSYDAGGVPSKRLKDWLAPTGTPAQLYWPGRDCYGTIIGMRSAGDPEIQELDGVANFEILINSDSGIPILAEDISISWKAVASTGEDVTVVDGGWADTGVGGGASAVRRLSVEIPEHTECGQELTVTASFSGPQVAENQSSAVEYEFGRTIETTIFEPPFDSMDGWDLHDEAEGQSAHWEGSSAHAAQLTTGAVILPEGPLMLRFEHQFAAEGFHDGGALEFSIDGGEWTDAGDLIAHGRYNARISSLVDSVLAGRDVWTGEQPQWGDVVLDLQTVSIPGAEFSVRWVGGTDGEYDNSTFWNVRNVKIFRKEHSCN